MAKQHQGKTVPQAKTAEQLAKEAADEKAKEQKLIPVEGSDGGNVGEKNKAIVEEVAATNPPDVPIGPNADPSQVSVANRDNWPGGGNPESPEFREAVGLGTATAQQLSGSPIPPARYGEAFARGFGAMRSAEPLYVVKTSWGKFNGGEQLTPSQVYSAGGDLDFLLSNGAMKPISAGGIPLMGVSESGMNAIDIQSHGQAVEAARLQAEDAFNTRTRELQAENTRLKADATHFDTHYNQVKDDNARLKSELEKVQAGAKEEAERSAKLETELMDAKDELARVIEERDGLKKAMGQPDTHNPADGSRPE